MPKKAIGLPDPKDYGDPSTLKAGDIVPYVRQLHEAKKAGRHYDVRLGKDKMFSWATRKEMPKPGEQIAMYPQPLHNEPYMHFQGRIGRGYGAGQVRTADKGEVQILKASPNNIKFAMAHTGEPEIYNMVRIQGKEKPFWLITNQTPTEAIAEKKIHYTKIPADKVDKLMDPKYVMSAKIDGAAAFAKMMKDHVDVLSYRTSKEGKPIMHTQRLQIPEKMNIPKELQNKVFRGEIYGEKGGKAIPAAKLGGLLNASLANSIRRQQDEKIKLKMALFGSTHPGEPEAWATRPREQVRSEVLAALQHLPKDIFTEPPYATTPEEKMRMWEDIKSGKNPLTREGVVGFPTMGGKPVKVKLTPEQDVIIRNIFPAQIKSGEPRAGGFDYSSIGSDKVVGRVGTGFDRETLKDMLKNPNKYVGRTARVEAMEKFPSGALRSPSFIALHEDMPKAASLLTPEQEEEIINKYYEGHDPSHGYESHVGPVRTTAMELAEKLKLAKRQRPLLDTAALLHDITRKTDKTDTHHETGAQEAARLLAERKLSPKQIAAIANMIRNHRASTKLEGVKLDKPSMILRDADRIAEANPLRRSYEYHLHNITPGNNDAAMMGALAHIMHKYNPQTGYGTKALHFPESKQKYTDMYNRVLQAYEEADKTTPINMQPLKNLLGETSGMDKAMPKTAADLPMKIHGLMRQGFTYDEAVKELGRLGGLVSAARRIKKPIVAAVPKVTKAVTETLPGFYNPEDAVRALMGPARKR